jgi:hypothetical protein
MTGRILLSCLLLPVAFLQAQELPPAQNGFHWQRIPDIKGAFLVPTGWYFKSETKGPTLGYFVTRENIDSIGSFKVGLTVNVVPRMKSRSALLYMNQFMDKLPEGRTVRRSWDANEGPFRGRGCLFEDNEAVMYQLAYANPKTNTLYLFLFEAPVSEWEDSWKLGAQIMQTLVIDDEI